MNQTANVLKFPVAHQQPDTDALTLSEHIDIFINKKRNMATRDDYRRELKRFFAYLKKVENFNDIDLSTVTEQDILVQHATILKYQSQLLTQMSNMSVRKSITPLRTFYRYLEANDYPVKSSWFNELEEMQDDTTEYAAFTYEQTMQAIEVVRNAEGTEKRDMKVALIHTAVFTGFRLSELLSIHDGSFDLLDGKTWTISIVGKRGKKNKKAIPKELYEELMAVRANYSHLPNPDGRIFLLQKNTVNKMMKLIRKELGLEAAEGYERYVFHSFKKCSVSEVFLITKDIKETQKQGNHSDPTLALKTYVKLTEDLHNAPNLRIGQKFDITDRLKDFSKEQLIKLIQKCDQSVHYELEMILNQQL